MTIRGDDVVIVEAVRSPLGRKGGGLAATQPADLLGAVLRACTERAGIDPADVGQIVGGCVEQVGEQAANVVRTAWLGAGLPDNVAAVSIDSACGSAQQAVGLACALVSSGIVDVAIGCGLSSMSRLPIAASLSTGHTPPPSKSIAEVDLAALYLEQFERYGYGQFGSAERIAEMYGITRPDADRFGLKSQDLAHRAWEEGRYDREVVPLDVPSVDDEGNVAEGLTRIARDEGLRDTSLEKLAALRAITGDKGIHTAGTSSQISDGAAAVLLTTHARALELGLRPRARIVDHCHVGVDPVVMLQGPLDATRMLLDRNKMTISDIDLFEVNEAFASVPLMWLKEFDADPDRLNVNGGAIALGHPVGATGARLVVSALHELERSDASNALITMCAGGGLGTGTLIERL